MANWRTPGRLPVLITAVSTASSTRPKMSSNTAAATMVLPTGESSLPRSISTFTETGTAVIASAVARNRAWARRYSDSGRNDQPNAKPPANGANNPPMATQRAEQKFSESSRGDISTPASNIRKKIARSVRAMKTSLSVRAARTGRAPETWCATTPSRMPESSSPTRTG